MLNVSVHSKCFMHVSACNQFIRSIRIREYSSKLWSYQISFNTLAVWNVTGNFRETGFWQPSCTCRSSALTYNEFIFLIKLIYLRTWCYYKSLQVTSLQVTSYLLQVTSYKLQVTSYLLQVTSLQVTSLQVLYNVSSTSFSCLFRIPICV